MTKQRLSSLSSSSWVHYSFRLDNNAYIWESTKQVDFVFAVHRRRFASVAAATDSTRSDLCRYAARDTAGDTVECICDTRLVCCLSLG